MASKSALRADHDQYKNKANEYDEVIAILDTILNHGQFFVSCVGKKNRKECSFLYYCREEEG